MADKDYSAQGVPEAGSVPLSDVQRLIDDALAKEREVNASQVQALQARIPQSTVPATAGGLHVDDFQPTWSQYDQELANRGEHPLQAES